MLVIPGLAPRPMMAVIPAAFQDGDFGSVAGALSGRQYTGGATSATSISASGYYAYHDIKAGIATGSQEDFVFQNGSDSSTRFFNGLLAFAEANSARAEYKDVIYPCDFILFNFFLASQSDKSLTSS